MKKNLFIVLDGIDGSGKGEQLIKLHNYLYVKDKKYKILTTREPTNGRYGEQIRKILENEKDPLENADLLLELYIKDRKEHLEKTIIPFLNESSGKECSIVLCDRYYYSTISYQQAQGIELKKLMELNKNFLKPDIAFILDLPAKQALARISDSRKKEKFEKIKFMEKVRKNFLKLKKILPDNIKVVDASKTIEQVFQSIKKELDKLID